MTISESGARVRERREALGLSRQALADRSGIYIDSIYNVETGRSKNPHGTTIALLNKALDEVEQARGEAPPAPEPTPAAISITIEGVKFEVPVTEWETIDRVIDRIMANLRKR